ncbi:MAG: DUF4407 domain-containing protein [Bacteroidales bacterium]|nr:DUF4407 domain-containing protein [Bacteroidales bacterium]
MLKICSKLIGEDYDLLRQDTPASRKKVMALASALFVPVILWFISTFLLCRNALGCSPSSSFVAASVAAGLIFLLERNIIMAKNSWFIASFRIALGFLIATLGSISIDEVLFKNDIDQQMGIIKEEVKGNSEKEIRAKYQNEIIQVSESINDKYVQWQDAQQEASREADGSGGSGIRGVHGITRIKMDIAKQREDDYIAEKDRMDKLQNDLSAEIQTVKDRIEGTFNNHALLYRIKAMFDLVFSDKFMSIIYIITTLIFFFMEFLVIILKMSWGKSNYERKVEMIEMIGQKRMEALINRDREYNNGSRQHPAYKKLERAVKTDKAMSVFK